WRPSTGSAPGTCCGATSRWCGCCCRRWTASAASRRRRESACGDPDVALAINGDAGRILWPLIALAPTTPARPPPSGRIELEDFRCAQAALACPRCQLRPFFVVLQRIHATIADPDVILGIDSDAGYGSQRPVFLHRKRLRP